jgi:hypothetical protein
MFPTVFRCIVELSNKEAANLERSGVWGEGRGLGKSVERTGL